MLSKTCLTLNDQCPSHIETSQLICRANQLTDFYVRGTLIVKGLKSVVTVQECCVQFAQNQH